MGMLGICMVTVPVLAQRNGTADLTSLQRLQDSYERGLNEGGNSIQNSFKTQHNGFMTQYLKSLNTLYDRLRKDSQDLDGMIIIREEIKRIQVDPTLRSEHVSGQHAQLGKMQKAYVEQLTSLLKERDERYVKFCEDYFGALKKLETKLVKADRIDDAVMVREEQNRVMEGDMYASTQQRLHPESSVETFLGGAFSNTLSNAVAIVPVEPEEPPELTGEALQKLVENVRKEHLIYRNGQTIPKVSSKKEVLHFTGHKSRSVIDRMSCMVYLQKIEYSYKRNSDSGYNYYYQMEHQVPRLEIKCGPKPRSNCVAIFDFYRKDGSKRFKDKTEKIPFGDLGINEIVVIDPAGYTNTKKSWYKSGGDTYSNNPKSQYAGYIVSVFDAAGELCFQRTSLTSLANYARNTP